MIKWIQGVNEDKGYYNDELYFVIKRTNDFDFIYIVDVRNFEELERLPYKFNRDVGNSRIEMDKIINRLKSVANLKLRSLRINQLGL